MLVIPTVFADAASASDVVVLCALGNFAPGKPPPLQRASDNPALDRALISELRAITDVIPVNPGFLYMLEDRENALAVQGSSYNGTNGTVLIGLKLVQTLMGIPSGGAAIAGVCAHECGHIYQYGQIDTGHPFFAEYNIENLTQQGHAHFELHADFIAGFYMGKRKEWSGDRVQLFINAIVRLGTESDQISHGTDKQRKAAIETGYLTASKPIKFADAARLGERYVRTLF